MTLAAPEHRTIVDRLAQTALFGELPRADLERLTAMGELLHLAPGEFLLHEGHEADALYLILDGELDVTKRSGDSEIPLVRVGPGSLQGDIAALEGGRRLASVRAVTATEAFRVPRSALRELISSGPDVAFAIIGTALSRLRGMEATLREREKLAGLGTLAAGVAHELNNPAASALRSVAALEAALKRLEALPRPAALPSDPAGMGAVLSGLDRADEIDALATLTGDTAAAATLVDAGWRSGTLAAQPAEAVRWLAADLEAHQLLAELRMAVGRIAEIVQAVKGYAYLDQAPVQCVDVRTGLEQTLVILQHRLKEGVAVSRALAEDLPAIEVYGSELNQVWTNLIDNAVDAMNGKGSLEVAATRDPDGDGVVVEICDSGPGIPAPVRGRLFEPFFTTKPPGKGTGLGLYLAHGVVARHGGRINVETAPGRTCFSVTLPALLPRR
jgi:signal transduction histidine kinase